MNTPLRATYLVALVIGLIAVTAVPWFSIGFLK